MNKLHIVFLLFILYANCPWEDPLRGTAWGQQRPARGLEDHLQAVPGTPGPSWCFTEREKAIIKEK